MAASWVFNTALAVSSQVGVAWSYHDDLGKAFVNGLTRGASRSWPFSLLEKYWGDRQGLLVRWRTYINFFGMVNATMMTKWASLPENKARLGILAAVLPPVEIALVSALFFFALRTDAATQVIGPRASLTPAEKSSSAR